MNASLLVPLAQGNRLWLIATTTGVLLLIINSWWLLLGAMVFIKFVILQEDT